MTEKSATLTRKSDPKRDSISIAPDSVPAGQSSDTSDATAVYVESPTELVDIGDLLLVRPGDLPPADGVVTRGQTTFDESSLTGESRPVKKSVGDEVWTGTANQRDSIIIRVTAVAKDTMVERLISAMNKASARKAPIAKIAEQFTSVFTPIIIYFSIMVLVIWLGASLSGAVPDDWLNADQRSTNGRVFFAFQL